MNQSIDLEAAQAAFFASGGQLVVLEGFTYRPLPERKRPEPIPKKRRGPAPVQHGTRQEKSKAKAEMIAELAATMTCSEASKHLNIPQATLWDVAKRNGFSFVQAVRGKHTPKPDDGEREAKLAEGIISLRDAGMSRYNTALALEVGHTVVSRIIKKFGIDFPLKKAGA